MTAEVVDLLARVAADLADRAAGGPTERLAARFTRATAAAEPRVVRPSRVPVVDRMQPIGRPLFDDLLAVSPALPWRPSHRVDDGGERVALVDFGECVDIGTLTVGAMAVGPDAGYPEHEHPPLEMYLVLGGTARWRHGGATTYVERSAGDHIVNHPNDRHGVRTGHDPVLAVYLLDT